MRIIIEFDNGATTTHDVTPTTGAVEPPYQTASGTGSSRAGATDAGSGPGGGAQTGAPESGTTTPGVQSSSGQSAGAAPQSH
jgi:hypothetical protein